MTNTFLGIDVSKATLDVALLNGKSHHAVFENTEKGFEQLQVWLEKQLVPYTHVCLEATGQYGYPVAEYLFRQGHQVSVVNPARINAYRKSCLVRNKTDKLDAFVIADFCQRQQPAPWSPPDPVYRKLREMVRYLDDLKNMRQQERNRRQSGLEMVLVIDMIDQHIDVIDHNIEEMNLHISQFMNENLKLKKQKDLLISIPGVAILSAAKFLAEIQDIQRFEDARQLAAYAGITPRQHFSGTSVRGKGRMSKTGNVHLRKSLYMPALVGKRCNPILHTFCDRLSDRGKPPKVVIGAAMRKLLHIVYGVLKNEQPFDPNYLNNHAVAA